jgi:hypothetical protein
MKTNSTIDIIKTILNAQLKSSRTVIDEFTTDFQKDPYRAMRWRSATIYAAARIQLCTEVLYQISTHGATVEQLIAMLEKDLFDAALYQTDRAADEPERMLMKCTAELLHELRIYSKINDDRIAAVIVEEIEEGE